MSDQPVLIMREGELAGQQWTISADEFLIGRGSECDLTLPERQVSREHVKILREDGRFILQDLGSKNGTHLNGTQVKGRVLMQDGDEIQVALCVRLVFIGTGATLPLSFDPPKPEKTLSINEAERSISVKDRRLRPPAVTWRNSACCNCFLMRTAPCAAATKSWMWYGPARRELAFRNKPLTPWFVVYEIVLPN